MSGAATAQWDIPESQIDLAKKQARILGCADYSIEQVINCLKQVNSISSKNISILS